MKAIDMLPLAWQSRFLGVLLVLATLVVVGCAATPARVQMDREVEGVFESGTIQPGYDYYYSGPRAEPRAVLAIRQGVDFEPGLWNRVDLTPELLATWNLRIDNPHRSSRYAYFGAYILDPNGNQVGMWYSQQRRPTVSWDRDGTRLTVLTPDPEETGDLIIRGGGQVRP